MPNVSVARRYARALIELANETAGLEVVQQQLDDLAQAVEGNSELQEVVTNPMYSRAQRARILEALMKGRGDIAPVVQNFIWLLNDRDRLAFLPDIARLFRAMADSLAGRIRGRVMSAAPLGDEPLRDLKKTLERLTQRQVILQTEIEPALLGGMKAQVGSIVYDGSLQSQLEALRRELKQS